MFEPWNVWKIILFLFGSLHLLYIYILWISKLKPWFFPSKHKFSYIVILEHELLIWGLNPCSWWTKECLYELKFFIRYVHMNNLYLYASWAKSLFHFCIQMNILPYLQAWTQNMFLCEILVWKCFPLRQGMLWWNLDVSRDLTIPKLSCETRKSYKNLKKYKNLKFLINALLRQMLGIWSNGPMYSIEWPAFNHSFGWNLLFVPRATFYMVYSIRWAPLLDRIACQLSSISRFHRNSSKHAFEHPFDQMGQPIQ